MKRRRSVYIFALMVLLIVPGLQAQKTYTRKKTLTASKPGLIFIRQNTEAVIKKLIKYLPATLNECRLANWTMKAPQPPQDRNRDGLASTWTTSLDGIQVRIYSSRSPGYEGLIIAGIKLTIQVGTGYDRAAVSKWIHNRFGTNTVVGSTPYRIEYRTNCWFLFRLNPKSVEVELKWNG